MAFAGQQTTIGSDMLAYNTSLGYIQAFVLVAAPGTQQTTVGPGSDRLGYMKSIGNTTAGIQAIILVDSTGTVVALAPAWSGDTARRALDLARWDSLNGSNWITDSAAIETWLHLYTDWTDSTK